MELIFWLSIFCIAFTYFGYPITLLVLKKKHYEKSDALLEEPVAILIAAANEEKRIVQKLENCLALEYKGLLNVIVALDAPTDNTVMLVRDWVRNHSHPKINFLYIHFPIKQGKEGVLKHAIDSYVEEEFTVFTDVATMLKPNTISQLMTNFADERVGAVDGMSSTNGSEGLYLRYENKIRELESKRNSLVTLGGCLFAVRSKIIKAKYTVDKDQSLISGFVSNLQSDLRTALMTKTAGNVAILDRNAIAEFPDVADNKKEFSRKHRTVVRALNVVSNHLYILNPLKYGVFSYQLICHKLLKWFVPFFMIVAYVSNIVLVTDILYAFILFFHTMFYTVAVIGWIDQTKCSKIQRIITFFVVSNLAILKAFYSYLKGERFVSWEATKR